MRKKRKKGDDNKLIKQREMETNKVKAVIFAPYTKNSELAKKLREAEERLEVLTGYRLRW